MGNRAPWPLVEMEFGEVEVQLEEVGVVTMAVVAGERMLIIMGLA